MHDRATVARALRLRDEEGLGARRAVRRLGIPVGTVRDWHAGKLPGHSQDGAGPFCPRCSRNEHHFDEFGRDYVYLLGV
jgi:hypothetical protein